MTQNNNSAKDPAAGRFYVTEEIYNRYGAPCPHPGCDGHLWGGNPVGAGRFADGRPHGPQRHVATCTKAAKGHPMISVWHPENLDEPTGPPSN